MLPQQMGLQQQEGSVLRISSVLVLFFSFQMPNTSPARCRTAVKPLAANPFQAILTTTPSSSRMIMSLFRCRTPSSLIYPIILYYFFLPSFALVCMCWPQLLRQNQIHIIKALSGLQQFITVLVLFLLPLVSCHCRVIEFLPGTSTIFIGVLCATPCSPISTSTSQLEVMCQSPTITREQTKAFFGMRGKQKRREGVRGRTKGGVIKLYCYASVMIIVKRLKMRCTQPSCVPGESW